MGKSARPRSLADTEAKAVQRMIRISPQKLNLVAQLIRGKKVATALADLEFSRKRIAANVRKCLESAIANAENNHQLDVDDLIVAEAHVGKALVMKRFEARAAWHPAVSRSRSRTSLSWCAKSKRRLEERQHGSESQSDRASSRHQSHLGFALVRDRGEYSRLLHEDIHIRGKLMKDLKQAAVSKVVIERPHKKARVTIHSARPGIVIGKKGADIDKLRKSVAK